MVEIHISGTNANLSTVGDVAVLTMRFTIKPAIAARVYLPDLQRAVMVTIADAVNRDLNQQPTTEGQAHGG